jgi:hypothetical protein
MYCILGFCSMMNVYRIINFLGARICLTTPSIMRRFPKSHSIHVQNPTKSPFSNKDLVWRFGICHGRQNKVSIYSICLCSICSHLKILGRWTRGYKDPCGMECLQKLSKLNRCQATNYQKPPRAYMVNIYDINLFNFFNSYTKDVIIYVLKVFWFRY